MGLLRRFIAFVCIFLTFSFGNVVPLFAVEQRSLRAQDVTNVMQKIFSQHVDKHRISEEIVRTSFKIYIDQFDPERIYLLESEAAPYLNMSSGKIAQVIRDYQQNRFTAYEELNDRIQKAIYRARRYRQSPLMRQQLQEWDYGDEEQLEERNERPFAQSIKELQGRQREQFYRFIAAEKRRYGEATAKKRGARIYGRYNRLMSSWENQYLFLLNDGKPLAAGERDNLFYLHVLKSLAKSLDAHTAFLNQREAFDMRIQLEKGFDGIGIMIKEGREGLSVARILPDSPAEKSGLIRVNDKILKIDGKDLTRSSIPEAMQLLRGKRGTAVDLALKRMVQSGNAEYEKTFRIRLRREPVILQDGRVETLVEQFGDGIIGTIKLYSFYQGENGVSSEEDIRRAIRELDRQGNLRGLILDLRENNGGFLTQAVKVAGLFITNGVIVVSKYSNGEQKYYRDMDGKVSYEGPLVVLTSKQTASAAEIVAQALQDYGVALVVGDRHTYGKGTIQSQTVTDEEGASFFKVTVGKYYTVSGKTPEEYGVIADVVVPGRYRPVPDHEYVEYPEEAEVIEPSFYDSLSDIDPGLRQWYLRYYMPTLQTKSSLWKEMLNILKQNSKHRISRNRNYQLFIEDNSDGISARSADYGHEDMQHQEAVNIVKDMIILEPEMKNRRESSPSGLGIGRTQG